MPQTFKITTNWQLLLRELGINPGNVLRHAELSADMLARDIVSLTEEQYFRLWKGIEMESGDRPLTLDIGTSFSLEVFDPAIFAALCSPNMNSAAQRLSRFKQLVGPLKLSILKKEEGTRLTISGIGHQPLPTFLGFAELIFFVQFARRATRSEIVPAEVVVAESSRFQAEYEDYFGVRIKNGNRYSVTFKTSDAQRPFLTANAQMWEFFEPLLTRRLAEINKEATIAERVHAALYEMLPGGRTSIDEVSSSLGMSTRSLQRYLSQEQTTFKNILNETREKLAMHYLGHSTLTAAEIAFLLGFDEPNSFYRAFRTWTGQTPQSVRSALP